VRRFATDSLRSRAGDNAPEDKRMSAAARGLGNRVGVALDFVSDWAILCFASWTLIAYLGMITGARVDLLTPLWLLTTPFLAGLLLLPRMRRNRAAAEPGPSESPAARATERPEGRELRLFVLALVAGLVAAALAAWPGNLPWAVIWIPALIAAGSAVLADKLRSRAPAIAAGTTGWAADVFAGGVGVLFAAMSLLVVRGNADDAFYVNRATAVRQLDHIPVLDVIFTHEQVARAGGAGLPNDSYSALQGAIARLIGVQAPTVSYFLFPPVFTFLAAWAMWRLVRSWAPRYAWICFAFGSVFWIWSSQAPLTSGSYFLSRIWQGKVAFVSWIVPTLYVYLTRWVGKRDALTAVLLLAAGLGSIGLTGSATFVVPLIILAVAIPLLARLEWPKLPVPLATAAIPFGIGIFLLLKYPLSASIGAGTLFPQAWFYHQVVGSALVGTVAAFGLWAAPWIARAGPPQRVATGLVVVFAVLIAPGVLELLSDVSGLTSTLRRVLWIVPFPALVGLIVAMPVLLRFGKLVPIAATVAASVLLVAFGTPLWVNLYGTSTLHYPPRWHVLRADTARAILDRYDGDKPILAEKTIMLALSIVTAEPKAVNARTHYLENTRLSPEQMDSRIVLTEFIMQPEPKPSEAVRQALAYLDVGLVCVAKDKRLGPYKEAFKAGGEVCAERVPSASG
jgi:MFS family permease